MNSSPTADARRTSSMASYGPHGSSFVRLPEPRPSQRATCMVSLSTGSGLSQYKELEAQGQLIGFPSLRSIQNHCAKEKFLLVIFVSGPCLDIWL